jgi:hypothetical protein
MGDALSEILKELCRDNQFVVVGDHDHAATALQQHFARRETFDAMSSAGVKHVFIEQPQVLAPLAQQLAEGSMTRDQFIDKLNENRIKLHDTSKETDAAVADMILNAKAAGITVHFADPGTGIATILQRKEREGNQLLDVIHAEMAVTDPARLDEMKRLTSGSTEDLLRNAEQVKTLLKTWHDALPAARQEALRKKFDSIWSETPDGEIAARLDDTALAEFIRSKAGNEKSVVFYGSSHGAYSNDLDDMLGTDKTRRIIMAPDKESYTPHREIDGLSIDPNPAVGIYYLRENRFEPTPRATPAMIDLGGLSRSGGLLDEKAIPSYDSTTKPLPARHSGYPTHN